jgi:hypothetical protein
MKENPQTPVSKARETLWNLGLILSSTICYTGALLLSIIWHLDILLYIVLAFFISCLLGAMAVDIRKSFIFTYVSMIMGTVAATAIFLIPHALIQESTVEFNFAVISLLTVIGKMVLIGLVIYFLGALIGSYLGERSM